MHDGEHVDSVEHLSDCPSATKGLNMSESIELPEPDAPSMAWDAVNRRHLTNREYADLLVRTTATERPAVPSEPSADGESEAPAKRKKRATAAGEFTDSPSPVQFRYPACLDCQQKSRLSCEHGGCTFNFGFFSARLLSGSQS
jgi:hypothetical protein